jgi:hypothetical protein
MKKVITLLSLLITGFYGYSQCTPKTSMTSYIEPEILENAVVGAPYSQVVYFKIPKDTMLEYNGNLISVKVVDARIESMTGKPASLSYACNISTCTFQGGTYGCATISGTPALAEVGDYAIKIMIKTNTLVLGFYNIARYDSGVYDFKVLQWPTSVGNSPSRNNLFSAYPNPAANEVTIKLSQINKSATIKLINMVGSVVTSHEITPTNSTYELSVNTSTLTDGLYLVEMECDGQLAAQRLLIKH